MRVGGLFTAIRTTLSGLSNQMTRLDAISENIANAEKAPDENGKVYQRKLVVANKTAASRASRFQNVLDLRMRRTNNSHMDTKGIQSTSEFGKQSQVKIVSQEGFKLEYNPSHPRADENGYVKMPKINAVEEMTDLLASTRTYEANVTVLNAAKEMAKKALEI
jgi:flagellar basal-body rod protein FlgC